MRRVWDWIIGIVAALVGWWWVVRVTTGRRRPAEAGKQEKLDQLLSAERGKYSVGDTEDFQEALRKAEKEIAEMDLEEVEEEFLKRFGGKE